MGHNLHGNYNSFSNYLTLNIAVQDFYTHSNWNTFFPRDTCDCFSNQTFWKYIDRLPEGLYTGVYPCEACAGRGDEDAPQHGDYCTGVNKDSYARPQWDESYTFGYYGTIEWINVMQTWGSEIDPAFVEQAKNFTADSDLKDTINKELEYMYQISLWIRTPGNENDGHWKGPGSGSLDDFTPAVARSLTLKSEFRDLLFNDNIHIPLTRDLYVFRNDTDETMMNTVIPVLPMVDDVIVEVRILHAETEDGSENFLIFLFLILSRYRRC